LARNAVSRDSHEFGGMWIATVSNIDWPGRTALPAATQQAELRALLDLATTEPQRRRSLPSPRA
jgi:hypothetical protein